MTDYLYNETGNLSTTLWTEGENNAEYDVKISIADTTGATLATATLQWTDAQGNHQSLSVVTRATDPQAYTKNTWEQANPPEELEAKLATKSDSTRINQNQTQQGNISVQAGTQVQLNTTVNAIPVYKMIAGVETQLNKGYTAEVQTAAPQTYNSSPTDNPPTLSPVN